MQNPRRTIRSLSALFAFEAAGRRLSFTEAARELSITQAAVSKHVAALEEELGTVLFTRHHREIRLTASGHELLSVTSQSLSAIAAKMQQLRSRGAERPITVGATITVSHFWLLPKLSQFRGEYPDMPIRVVSEEATISLADGKVDMAIRFGAGHWADGQAKPLMRSRVVVMAAPSLVQAYGPIKTAADVMRLPLIDYDALDESWASWDDWLQEAGLSRLSPPRLSFNRYSDALRAAASGQGALLVWSGLTGGIEESGLLVPLPGPVLTPRGDFYLVSSARADRLPQQAVLENWLIEEARRSTTP